MTDRFITVPDSLELPAAVKVGVDRLHDSTVAGRALLTGADAAAQRSSLGLGTAAVADAADFEAAGTTATTGDAYAPVQSVAKPPRATWISTFQSGHGFSNTGVGTLTNDTGAGNFIIGTQSLRIASTNADLALTLDMTGRNWGLWVRANTIASNTNLSIYATSDNWANHAVWSFVQVTDYARPYITVGEWCYITIPWEASTAVVGTPNRAAITKIRLTAQNGDFNVQAVGWVPKRTSAARITFTLDDGFASWLTAAAPIFAKHGVRPTGYVIPDMMDTAGMMTTAGLRTLQDVYGWDIEAHGQTHLSTLTAAQMRAEWTTTKRYLRANGLGRGDHLAYPYGEHDASVVATAREFFASCRTIAAAVPVETWPPAMAHRIRAVTGVSSMWRTLEATKAIVDKAVAAGEWLVLTFHKIDSTVTSSLICSPADLDALLAYCVASGAEIVTMRDACR